MSKTEFDQSIIFTLKGHEGSYQSVPFTGTSATSASIQGGIRPVFVLLYADQNCHVRSVDPASSAVATVTDTFLPANVQVHFSFEPGTKVSVISDGVDGTLHVSPVS